MNVHTQANWLCFNLFGIVAVTCRLFDGDHKTVVLGQKELCLHFIKILETKLDSTISYMEHLMASRQNQ